MSKLSLSGLSFFFACLLLSSVHAQTAVDPVKDSDAKDAALRTCVLMNEVLDDLHPDILKMIDEMLELGEAKAIENFTVRMDAASEEDQAIIMADVQKMMNFDSLIDQEKVAEIEADFEKYNGDTEFEGMILKKMESIPACTLSLKMIKISEMGSS